MSMKLSEFISRVLKESDADEIHFDLAVDFDVEKQEILVAPASYSVGGTNFELQSHIKFTVKRKDV